MHVFAMFSIVMLAMGLLELGFFAACLIAFIVGCCLHNKIVIISSLAIPATFIMSGLALSYVFELENPFPDMKEQPVESTILGTYVLAPDSFDYLKSRGFNDLSATIVLKDNDIFTVMRMPHIWTNGAPESSGYDSGSGTWSVGQGTDGNFNITMMADKSLLPEGAVFLGISPPKGTRTDFALAVPIYYGDFEYIYFVRKHD